MGQVREEVESKILEKYREKGTITEDEIVDICLDYDLNLIEIDSICERIFSKKVILSILVDTFISKISFPMQPGPEIGSISDA